MWNVAFEEAREWRSFQFNKFTFSNFHLDGVVFHRQKKKMLIGQEEEKYEKRRREKLQSIFAQEKSLKENQE